MQKDPFLSKSKYLAGLQCPKLLWMHYHAKDKFPPTDIKTQAIFDQGHQVTKVAHSLFPGGIEIPGADEYEKIIKESQLALSLNKPIFEAGFGYKNTYARADILKPGKKDIWDLYEVKSSTEIKDVNYPDVGFQVYCYEGAGIKIGKVYLVYINNQYVKDGPINPEALLIQEEVTDRAREASENSESQINRMMEILKKTQCPKVKIGLQCDNPYGCPLKSLCWDFLPKENIFIFNRIRKNKAFELIDKGILAIKDVDENYLSSPSHKIQWECHSKNKVHITPSAIKLFLDQLKFPIYFLDFETAGPAVPFYDQSRPYQQVPFQYSLHILPGWDKKELHHAFLAKGMEDPRPELLSRLRSLIGDEGSILSYNMSFELSRLRESVEAYPEYERWLEGIEKRFFDLIVPFRSFDYYDPKQLGRTSIKNVFPALTGGTYDGLAITDGGTASLEFARITFNDGIPSQEKERVRKGLEIYCALDTKAMIDILKVLKAAADNNDTTLS